MPEENAAGGCIMSDEGLTTNFIGMNPYYGSMGFGFWDFAWHVLIIVFIVWILLMIFRGGRWGRRMGGPQMWDMWQSHSALSILNERFAKGEISKEEYEERKKTLMS